ncbi:MAG: hypothetical protein ACW98K_14215 [Candidatus Kariarchaeaceae archaeon]|jgi:hypothetical protein
MGFIAVFVISVDSRDMVSLIYQSEVQIPDTIISAGLLTALREFTFEWEQAEREIEKSFTIENLNYHVKKFGAFSVVLVDQSLNQNIRIDLTHKIGWTFLRKYGEIDLITWGGNRETFASFKENIEEILDDYIQDDFQPISQISKRLTTADIFELDQSLQPTALALLTLEMGTLADLANEIDSDVKKAEEHLQVLQSEGFITLTTLDGVTYFTASD